MKLRRFPDHTQLVVHRRLVGCVCAQHPTLHHERPLLQTDDLRASSQLNALMCRSIPPGAPGNQLDPADTAWRIALKLNDRPVWLAGEVAVEATAGMT
jgi:hypothetical protein